MTLAKLLETMTTSILDAKWDFRVGRVVPATGDVALAGGSVEVEATILYSDLRESSSLVNKIDRRVAAKAIKAFLTGACRVIRSNGGTVVSFDGDRVMAVFVGEQQCSRAARAALKINYFVKRVLGPKLATQFVSLQQAGFEISHCTGIDSGTVIAVRAGVRGTNDLVWIGRSANLAAARSEVRDEYASYITEAVFKALDDDARVGGPENESMWERATWKWKGEEVVLYRSKWRYVA